MRRLSKIKSQAEHADLKLFFEEGIMGVIESECGAASFWNGLGATSASTWLPCERRANYSDPTIYSVSCELFDMHMFDLGLEVTWKTVPIPDSVREEVWQGVRRRYWDLPSYEMPLVCWDMPHRDGQP